MLSAQRVRHQEPRSRPQLGRRLPRRQRDPDRVLASRSRPARSARRWRTTASTTPTWSSTRTRPAQKQWNYLVRVGAVSVVSEQQAKQIRESLAKIGDASLKRFEWSEGGDKIYLRYDKPVEPTVLGELAQGDRRQHDAGAALRPRRRQHLRGDAGRPRHRDPAARSTRSWARARSRRSRRSSRSAPRPASSCRTTASSRCSSRSC